MSTTFFTMAGSVVPDLRIIAIAVSVTVVSVSVVDDECCTTQDEQKARRDEINKTYKFKFIASSHTHSPEDKQENGTTPPLPPAQQHPWL